MRCMFFLAALLCAAPALAQQRDLAMPSAVTVGGPVLAPKPDPGGETWAVTGTCVAEGNIYPDVPEDRATSATAARRRLETAVRAVLRCTGRAESDATAIMQTVRLTGLATSGASWAGWIVPIDDRNFASAVVTRP